MTKTDNQNEVGLHIFERAGLGKAPYRFTGMAEKVFSIPGVPEATKPGSSCDYCGTAIRSEFWLKSADGRSFKVGCDCINKSGDKGLIAAYKSSPEYRRAQAEKRETKARGEMAELSALIERHGAFLTTLLHPQGFIDRKTGQALSLLDYANWYMTNAGAAGRRVALQTVRTAVKGAGELTDAQRAQIDAKRAEMERSALERAEAEKAAVNARVAQIAANRWLINELTPRETTGTGFVANILARLAAGDNPGEFSARMLAVLADIVASNYGRRGSKVYNAKFDEVSVKLGSN